MENNNLAVLETPFNPEEVKIEELPGLIKNQINMITDVKGRVETAMSAAMKASDKAKETDGMKVGFGHKKVAIEALQDTAITIAEAQTALADAQKISFEYQEVLSKVTAGLYVLGTLSLANNRTVVRQLQLQLENASEEELDELAKQEINNVIKQLQSQEDIMIRQEELENSISKSNKSINTVANAALKNRKTIEENRTLIDKSTEKQKRQDRILQQQKEKDKEHDKLIEKGQRKNAEQDELILKAQNKNIEQDKLLVEGVEKDIEQDKLISEGKEKDVAQDKVINELFKKNSEQEKQISMLADEINALKTNLGLETIRRLTYIGIGVAGVALILAVMHFLFDKI